MVLSYIDETSTQYSTNNNTSLTLCYNLTNRSTARKQLNKMQAEVHLCPLGHVIYPANHAG